MTIALLLLVLTLLISFTLIRNFVRQSTRVKALARSGVSTQGQIVEVRNDGLKQNAASNRSEIAIRFPVADGKTRLVRYKKELQEGEIISVGSAVELTYLEADPRIYNVPSLGLYAGKNWQTLIAGVLVLLIGVFVAYVIYINTGVQ